MRTAHSLPFIGLATVLAAASLPLVGAPSNPRPTARKAPSSRSVGAGRTLAFSKYRDKTEMAFTVLVPKGWQTEGGIVRVNAAAAGGPAQSISAKIAFAAKKDAEGTAMVAWLPEVVFIANPPASEFGFFQPGSLYSGMVVWPYQPPLAFLEKMVIPRLRPEATGVTVVERTPMREVAAAYEQLCRALAVPEWVQFDAAALTVSYEERGTKYRERLFTILQNMGEPARGMWSNKITIAARAPAAEVERWAPVECVVVNSFAVDGLWLMMELKGQRDRAEIARQYQQEIQKLDAEIAANRRRTNALIQHDQYLTVTGQMEHVDPNTGAIELGPADLPYRWVNASGDVILSDRPEYDPAKEHLSGYKLSKVHERKVGGK